MDFYAKIAVLTNHKNLFFQINEAAPRRKKFCRVIK